MVLQKKRRYTTVHLPVELLQLVDNIIEDGKYGYSSRAEFVKDAIRRYLEWHGYIRKKGDHIINEA